MTCMTVQLWQAAIRMHLTSQQSACHSVPGHSSGHSSQLQSEWHLDNAVPVRAREHDVAALEVAVPHIVGVQVLQGMQQLPHHEPHLVLLQLAPAHTRFRVSCVAAGVRNAD